MGASQFCSPHPKSLSQSGRGTLNSVPLLPFWEKGLGDEGKLAKLGCSRFLFSFFYFRSWPWFPAPRGERKKKEEGRTKKGKGKEAAGMVCGGQEVFYFRFSIFVLALGFRPPGRKKEKRRTKNEKGKRERGCWHGLWRPTSFLFSFFYFRFFPWFPSPCGVRRVRDPSSLPGSS